MAKTPTCSATGAPRAAAPAVASARARQHEQDEVERERLGDGQDASCDQPDQPRGHGVHPATDALVGAGADHHGPVTPGRSPGRSGTRSRPVRAGSPGDEVDQLLDRPQQRHLQVGVRVDGGRGPAASRPAGRPSRAAGRPRSSSPRPRGTAGQARMPSAAGFTACQTSTYGWPRTSTSGAVTRGHDPALLGARHQVVDQHAEPAAAAPGRSPDPPGQLVDAVQRLDHDRLDPQVVAPDPLDQGGVVPALDPDPAAPGDLGAGARHGDRAGRGAAGLAGAGAARGRTRVTGRPSRRNPAGASGNIRRFPRRSSSVTASLAHSTTAPQKPVPASSTTRSGSAATSGTTALRRHSPASTSAP